MISGKSPLFRLVILILIENNSHLPRALVVKVKKESWEEFRNRRINEIEMDLLAPTQFKWIHRDNLLRLLEYYGSESHCHNLTHPAGLFVSGGQVFVGREPSYFGFPILWEPVSTSTISKYFGWI